MMRRFWRKNDGLTLVELMVSIAIGTMIFAAATTVLLLGFRIHGKTTDSIEQQYTARMVVTMLEDMASDGDMGKIKRELDGSWWVFDQRQENVIISYSAENQAIYAGSQPEPVLKNIVASYLILNNKNVLTISLEDPDRTYSSSIFCRTVPNEEGEKFDNAHIGNPSAPPGELDKDKKEQIAGQKTKFMGHLLSQVGTKGGIINQEKHAAVVESTYCRLGCQNFSFFSQWWVIKKDNAAEWSTDTPWCACFVSWALCHIDGVNSLTGETNWFANVDEFMSYFKDDTAGGWKTSDPSPGDLIFFDMINGSNDNPSHMGVVLSVTDNVVTTIEGNSADMVAIREYTLPDKRILGYGDPWAAQPIPSEKPDAS